MGRRPELFSGVLGALKAGLTVTPLFSAFGPEPIRARMEIGEASALLTTESLYRRKIAPWRSGLPSLRLVLLLDCQGDPPEGCLSLPAEMESAPDRFETARTGPQDPALIHFTSGTTGRPSTRRSWRMRKRGASRSTCAPATSSGAPPIPAG
jgi:acetyl-CoA synthetase